MVRLLNNDIHDGIFVCVLIDRYRKHYLVFASIYGRVPNIEQYATLFAESLTWNQSVIGFLNEHHETVATSNQLL